MNAPPPGTSSLALSGKLVERLVRALTYVGGALLLLGLGSCWRLLLRREHLVVAGMNLLLLSLIRIRFPQAGLDLRYFMPLVLVSLPWMALGFFQLVAWSFNLFSWLWTVLGRSSAGPQSTQVAVPRPFPLWRPWQWAVVGLLVLLTAAGGVVHGSLAAAKRMRRQAELGRWIRQSIGPNQRIYGTFLLDGLTPYYADGQLFGILCPSECQQPALPWAIRDRQADLVVVWLKDSSFAVGANVVRGLAERIASQGAYRRVPADELPVGPDYVLVFVRSDCPVRPVNVAQSPPPGRG